MTEEQDIIPIRSPLPTRHWIQWLLEYGWTLSHIRRPGAPDESIWRWRSPGGLSGTSYESSRFDELPGPVEDYIKSHAIMGPP